MNPKGIFAENQANGKKIAFLTSGCGSGDVKGLKAFFPILARRGPHPPFSLRENGRDGFDSQEIFRKTAYGTLFPACEHGRASFALERVLFW